jgi:hypothetical protein
MSSTAMKMKTNARGAAKRNFIVIKHVLKKMN